MSTAKVSQKVDTQWSALEQETPLSLVLLAMFQSNLALESVFEDHGVCTSHHRFPRPRASNLRAVPWFGHLHKLQLANKRKNVRLLTDLTVIFAFLPQQYLEFDLD